MLEGAHRHPERLVACSAHLALVGVYGDNGCRHVGKHDDVDSHIELDGQVRHRANNHGCMMTYRQPPSWDSTTPDRVHGLRRTMNWVAYRQCMRHDRVRTMAEARTGYVAPVRRAAPLPRATVQPGDAGWMHAGWTVQLEVRGRPTDLFGCSIMATALCRSPETVGKLIRSGVLPEAPYRSPGRGRFGQKRLWTRQQIMLAAAAVELLKLQGRPRRWAGSRLPEILAAV